MSRVSGSCCCLSGAWEISFRVRVGLMEVAFLLVLLWCVAMSMSMSLDWLLLSVTTIHTNATKTKKRNHVRMKDCMSVSSTSATGVTKVDKLVTLTTIPACHQNTGQGGCARKERMGGVTVIGSLLRSISRQAQNACGVLFHVYCWCLLLWRKNVFPFVCFSSHLTLDPDMRTQLGQYKYAYILTLIWLTVRVSRRNA